MSNCTRTRRILVFVATLALLLIGTVSEASATPLSSCATNVPMYTRDDGFGEHNKHVGIYVPTDVTARYDDGKAYITYDNGWTHLRFDRNTTAPFRMGAREKNL